MALHTQSVSCTSELHLHPAAAFHAVVPRKGDTLTWQTVSPAMLPPLSLQEDPCDRPGTRKEQCLTVLHRPPAAESTRSFSWLCYNTIKDGLLLVCELGAGA